MIEAMVMIEPGPITIAPESLAEEVLQNVRMILCTPVGSLPLDRDFGLDFSVLDQPLPRARALLSAEIAAKVARYEPRAQVTRVDWDQAQALEAADGRLAPAVKVRIQDGAA